MLLRRLDGGEFQGPHVICAERSFKIGLNFGFRADGAQSASGSCDGHLRQRAVAFFQTFFDGSQNTAYFLHVMDLTVHHGTCVMFLAFIPQNACVEAFTFAYQTDDAACADV